ncbi:hypothetical protein HanPI659440_Chr09g0326291 [Helianthus annuus]|nr:hypothetical protein HanPI659440_Chr09g0326291 [Helianthus annuus]
MASSTPTYHALKKTTALLRCYRNPSHVKKRGLLAKYQRRDGRQKRSRFSGVDIGDPPHVALRRRWFSVGDSGRGYRQPSDLFSGTPSGFETLTYSPSSSSCEFSLSSPTCESFGRLTSRLRRR